MTIHRDVSEANMHEPKGASTAVAGTTYISDGAGSGTWQKAGGANVVVVNSLTDLPAAVGGKHTLAANTHYLFAPASPIALGTNYIQVSEGSSVGGVNLLRLALSYAGSGSMFVGVDASFVISEIRVDCPSAQVFDMSDTVGGVKIFRCASVTVDSCTKFATCDDLLSNLFENSNCPDADDGVTLIGTNSLITSMRQFALLSSSATFKGIDFGTSVQNNVELLDYIAVAPAGGVGIAGAAASANMVAGTIAAVSRCSFAGGIAPLSGITIDDVRWDFRGNSGIPDTMPDSLMSMIANATATVTPVGVPTLVAGTWVDERKSHFTNSAAGRATYVGERGLTSPITATISVDPASGTNKFIRGYIAINGTVKTGSGQSIRVDAGNPLNLTLIWQEELAENDYVEVYIANTTDSTNVTVIDAVLRTR